MNAINRFQSKVDRTLRAAVEIGFRKDLLALSCAVEVAERQAAGPRLNHRPPSESAVKPGRHPDTPSQELESSPGLAALAESLRAASSHPSPVPVSRG